MALVFVETWQQECCGDPFAVGDEVSWPVVAVQDQELLAVRLGRELSGRVTACVERHAEHVEELRLRVNRIRSAFCAYEKVPGQDRRLPHGETHRPVPGTTVLRDVRAVDRGHQELEHLHWLGYVVDAQPFD